MYTSILQYKTNITGDVIINCLRRERL